MKDIRLIDLLIERQQLLREKNQQEKLAYINDLIAEHPTTRYATKLLEASNALIIELDKVQVGNWSTKVLKHTINQCEGNNEQSVGFKN